MNPRYLILILLLACVLPCTAKEPKKVKKMTTVYHRKKQRSEYGRITQTKLIQNDNFEVYDTSGRIIEQGDYGEVECMYLPGGSVADRWDYKKIRAVTYLTYDSLGNKQSEEDWKFRNNQKDYCFWKAIYEYNDTGNLVSEMRVDGRTLKPEQKTYYAYPDRFLTIIYDTSYDRFSKVLKIKTSLDTVFKDSLGNIASRVSYNNGKFTSLTTYERNKNGWWTRRTLYKDRQGKNINYEVKRVLDEDGKILEISEPYSYFPSRDVYVYDKFGHIKEVLHYERGEFKYTTKYKYY
ncbi:MAG: hypothetical protein EOP51_00005 [Sphingobacteriales bacterium]|nr:MAG: hypothetical protein EOP51_00005 [Sphingobacteriales bacterium]